jgi:hypothetical protein
MNAIKVKLIVRLKEIALPLPKEKAGNQTKN